MPSVDAVWSVRAGIMSVADIKCRLRIYDRMKMTVDNWVYKTQLQYMTV